MSVDGLQSSVGQVELLHTVVFFSQPVVRCENYDTGGGHGDDKDVLFVIELCGGVGTRTLLGAKGIATRSKNATRGSWPYY